MGGNKWVSRPPSVSDKKGVESAGVNAVLQTPGVMNSNKPSASQIKTLSPGEVGLALHCDKACLLVHHTLR